LPSGVRKFQGGPAAFFSWIEARMPAGSTLLCIRLQSSLLSDEALALAVGPLGSSSWYRDRHHLAADLARRAASRGKERLSSSVSRRSVLARPVLARHGYARCVDNVASMPRALSQRASQKPSRPASKATVMRSILRPASLRFLTQRLSSFAMPLCRARLFRLTRRLARCVSRASCGRRAHC